MDRLNRNPSRGTGRNAEGHKPQEVLRELERTNAGKAAGPVRIKPGLLKTYAEQLCSILCVIFNQSLSQCSIPALWKTSCIIPVSKKTTVKVVNDLRPVALTSAIMKVFERVVLS